MVNGHVCNFLFILLFSAHLFFISSILLHFALSITNKLCERLLKTYFEQTLPFYYRCQNLRIKSSRPTKDLTTNLDILGFKTKVGRWIGSTWFKFYAVMYYSPPKKDNLITDIYESQNIIERRPQNLKNKNLSLSFDV